MEEVKEDEEEDIHDNYISWFLDSNRHHTAPHSAPIFSLRYTHLGVDPHTFCASFLHKFVWHLFASFASLTRIPLCFLEIYVSNTVHIYIYMCINEKRHSRFLNAWLIRFCIFIHLNYVNEKLFERLAFRRKLSILYYVSTKKLWYICFFHTFFFNLDWIELLIIQWNSSASTFSVL